LLADMTDSRGRRVLVASHPQLGNRYLYCAGEPQLLFTENETNNERVFGAPNASPYVKDGINDFLVSGKKNAINPERKGTKASAHYQISVEKVATLWLRLSDQPPATMSEPFAREFGDTLQARHREADEFYRAITPGRVTEDEVRVMRQALSGMLWSKQYF